MKELHEIWNVEASKIDTVAEYPFKLRSYTYTETDLAAFKAMCRKTGTDPRQGEIYPQWDGFRFVPTLTSDGWLRVANDHPQFDGMAITYSEKEVALTIGETTVIGSEFVEVTVYRKDRAHQSTVREYFREAFNQFNPTHFTHPNRNTRHKAVAQAVKIAFGISGAYVQGEAEALSAAAPGLGGSNNNGQKSVASENKPTDKQPQEKTHKPRIQTQALESTPEVKVIFPKTNQEPVIEPATTEDTTTVEPAQEQVKEQAPAISAEVEQASEVELEAKEESTSPAENEIADTANNVEQAVNETPVEPAPVEQEVTNSDEPNYQPTADQQAHLERFLQYTKASGHFKRAHDFLNINFKDEDERNWYAFHLGQLSKEVSYA